MTMADKKWKLIYWPGFSGRGDFVRLMFEEAGVPYEDVGNTEGVEAVLRYYQGKHGGYPVLAPPIIENDDGFLMCSTPAILLYLGKLFNMCPSTLEDEARAMQVHTLHFFITESLKLISKCLCLCFQLLFQINGVVADYLDEGHDAFHPVDKHGTHDSQKEESIVAIKKFCEIRLPKYANYFNTALVSYTIYNYSSGVSVIWRIA